MAIVLSDSKRRALVVNDRMIEMFGYSEAELIGYDSRKLYPGREEFEQVANALYHASSKVNAANVEVRMRRKDGEEIQVLLSSAPLRPGNPDTELVVALMDITTRKSLETQLLQSQKMEAIGQLAGGVAHDFNNMLQVILGFTDTVLFDLEDDSAYREPLVRVQQAAERAAALTRQLLAFSRRQVLKLAPIDLNQLVENLMKMVHRLMGEDIELLVAPASGLETVNADQGQIEQVLLNLCLNARDAMPEGGRLTIETQNVVFDEDYCQAHDWARPGRHIMVSVSDSGCGMDEETRLQIFEPFFTTKEEGKGTGLGLATVYGIIRQHQGMIQVYSEPGKGTRFTLYLPAIDQQLPVSSGLEVQKIPGGNETILMAEDNEHIRIIAKEMLEEAGYKVLTAIDGQEALHLFNQHEDEIKMLFLDIVMPKIGGRAVYEEISLHHPGIKCLFISGYSQEAVHTNFIHEAGLNLLQKPFRRDELLQAVRETLDKD